MASTEFYERMFNQEIERLLGRGRFDYEDEHRACELLDAVMHGMMDATLSPSVPRTPKQIVAEARQLMASFRAAEKRLQAAFKERREKPAFDLSAIKEWAR